MSHTRSRNGTNRPNYAIDNAGLDIPENEDQDADYMDTDKNVKETKEDDENEEDVQDRNSQRSISTRNAASRGRGRPPKRTFNAIEGSDGENSNPVAEQSETDRSRSNSVANGTTAAKKKHYPYPVDKDGNPLPVVNEEYELPEDAEGETKITKDGDLLGGRKFLVRTFTLTDKGNVKFMLSTEPARAVGFRDSYLFFQYHPNLFKFVISQDQKNSLIDRGVLPYSYRSRQIALVTAKSVFREFGSKIIQNGKNITDDYYAIKLREEGKVIEGTLSREPSKKNLSKQGNDGNDIHSVNGINPARNAVEFFERRNQNHRHNADTTLQPNNNQINSTNWLYQHAAASSRFNSDIYYDRVRVLLIEGQGIRDPYTNVLHIPANTQPTKVIGRYKVKEKKNDGSIKFDTIIKDDDLRKPITGLKDVPKEIYEDLLNENLIKEIENQKNFESSI
ncbi:hypothetical protein C6P45_003665 [Maudiozyma exigua]|uniref:Chromatin structure-remodeling complex subunit RSC7 n=1 Tax=Maudiozyma exigua TaxID=34358 RepID=A0A9P6WEP2_MAUEX|nr:hypothetical protein C6P45_003665 [Kazachstania exigua]